MAMFISWLLKHYGDSLVITYSHALAKGAKVNAEGA
jgi:hypothetical protein